MRKIRRVGPNARRRPAAFLPGGSNAAAVVAAPAAQATAAASANGAQGFVQPPPILRSSFLFPSINAQYPTITWTQAQFEAEFSWMTSAGIHEIVLQWTVDQDANESYFNIGATTLPPQYNNMVLTCLEAAAACGVDVWLGLCNTSNWQAHATDNTWLYNQYYLNTVAATQLMTLFSGSFVGWYVSNETNDQLMMAGADVSEQTAFFQDNTSWLHANTGLPVMTSPTFSYSWPTVNETPAQFAASCAAVLGTFDVIAVQDGTGDHSVNPAPSDLTAYFTALQAQFAGTPGIQIWQNCDMYDQATGSPDSAATLAANMAATTGLVSKYIGFSFTSQMDPLTTSPVGNWSYYQAYRAYAEAYFDKSDWTGAPAAASASASASASSAAQNALPGAATIQAVSERQSVAVSCLPGAASASFVSYAPVSNVSALPGAAQATFVAYAPSGFVGAQAHPALASSALVAEQPSVAVTTLPGAALASFVSYAATGSAVHSAYPGVAGITVVVYQPVPGVSAKASAAALAAATAEAATDIISQPVFPATAMMSATAIQPGVVAFAPDPARTYFIPFEDRTCVVTNEDRVVAVGYEDRTEVIVAEDRVVAVAFEDRTDVVSNP